MSLTNFPFRRGLRWSHHTRLEQHIDAVVYVSVVFVLFAAIILLLITTSCRRLPPPASLPTDEESAEESQPLRMVARLKKSGAGVCTETLAPLKSV